MQTLFSVLLEFIKIRSVFTCSDIFIMFCPHYSFTSLLVMIFFFLFQYYSYCYSLVFCVCFVYFLRLLDLRISLAAFVFIPFPSHSFFSQHFLLMYIFSKYCILSHINNIPMLYLVSRIQLPWSVL